MTELPCTRARRFGEIRVDFKDPATAQRYRKIVRRGNLTFLGRKRHGKITRQSSVHREFRTVNLRISDSLCRMPNFKKLRKKTSVFYTDVYGRQMRTGPGRRNVKQFISRGFSLTISGFFEIAEPWTAEYRGGHRGRFPEIGHGIDPNRN